MRLALLTFGLLRAVPGDPEVAGFVELTDPPYDENGERVRLTRP